MKNTKFYLLKITKTIGAIGLIILALLLFIIVTPLALIWRISKGFKQLKLETGANHYFIEIAASFDQLGCAVFGGFFNWLFIDNKAIKCNNYYSFGDKDETISEVLGWNQYLKSLSKIGKVLVCTLDKLDRNHCQKAMSYGVNKAKSKIQYSEKLGML
jgi:hypothetical protein